VTEAERPQRQSTSLHKATASQSHLCTSGLCLSINEILFTTISAEERNFPKRHSPYTALSSALPHLFCTWRRRRREDAHIPPILPSGKTLPPCHTSTWEELTHTLHTGFWEEHRLANSPTKVTLPTKVMSGRGRHISNHTHSSPLFRQSGQEELRPTEKVALPRRGQAPTSSLKEKRR